MCILRFSPGALLNIVNDYWKLIRIGQAPVGLGNNLIFFKSSLSVFQCLPVPTVRASVSEHSTFRNTLKP